MKTINLVCVLMISGSLTGCAMVFAGNAQANLETYTKAAGLKPIQCSNQDSEDDGYVSCDAQTTDGQTVALDCGYMPFSKGCKTVDRFKGRYK